MNIPGTARQGDTWEWNDNSQVDPQGNVLASPIYTLHYRIVGLAAALTLDGTLGTFSGNGWTFTATPTQTQAMPPGTYDWQAYCDSAAGDRFTVGHGNFTVTPDFVTQATGVDNRSIAKQIIDAIDAGNVTATASGFVVEYSIAGRMVRKELPQNILAVRSYYAAIYGREVCASRIRQGLGDPKKSFAMFGPRRAFSIYGGFDD